MKRVSTDSGSFFPKLCSQSIGYQGLGVLLDSDLGGGDASMAEGLCDQAADEGLALVSWQGQLLQAVAVTHGEPLAAVGCQAQYVRHP